MKPRLARFGVAMDASLLGELDHLVKASGTTRSKVLSDLVRKELFRARLEAGVEAVASLTLVYDHHVRDLTERLTQMQHDLGDRVRAAMHVHLDNDRCLEVIVMRGTADQLHDTGEKLLGTRGVTHGGMEIVATAPAAPSGHNRHRRKSK